MEVGAKVWIYDKDGLWEPGEVTSRNSTSIFVRVGSKVKAVKAEVAAINTDGSLLQLRNDDEYAHPPNLISLQHLHEPALLHALTTRYEKDEMYTYIGDILLAINPFKQLGYYTEREIDYYERSVVVEGPRINASDLAPHIYGVAAGAHKHMIGNNKNQSVLVSGESGAGKTESTKFIMQYLAKAGSQKTSSSNRAGAASVQQRVLQSNPILEAFGNARTLRNDNSSRFGKFIEIQFDKVGALVGARIRTYLLEKVRLLQQSTGERNFHIFYELLAGCSVDEKKKWKLGSIQDYQLLNRSGCYERLDGIRDEDQFKVTRQAMVDVGINSAQQDSILSTVSGLLHLGNLRFQDIPSLEGGSKVSELTMNHLIAAASLFEVDADVLKHSLVTRSIRAGEDHVIVKLNAIEAMETCQSLAKMIYNGLFSWIVDRIGLAVRNDSAASHTIGILDVFGFEVFEKNGFEQLCINYANESLQRQFNDFVFKFEQELYKDEEIEWKFIDFPSNDGCLALFEKRPYGILSLLDQECMLPGGSNGGLAAKLYGAHCEDGSFGEDQRSTVMVNDMCFSATRVQQVNREFTVKHFAGKVCYSVDQFLEKNQDILHNNAANLLQSSASPLIASIPLPFLRLSASNKPTNKANRHSGIKAPSVSSKFKDQLRELLDVIQTTKAHYVRCIKPNDLNIADSVNRERLIQQLHSGGVLEAVRVARAGYSVRMDHHSFHRDYKFLIPSEVSTTPMVSQLYYALAKLLPVASDGKITMVELGKESSMEVLKKVCLDVGFQVGKTKVFFRKDVFTNIEEWRYRKRVQAAVKLQSCFRRYKAQKRYAECIRAVVKIQAAIRGLNDRNKVKTIRWENAATRIQTQYRCWKCSYRFRSVYSAILSLQRKWRYRTFRRNFYELLRSSRAVFLQRIVRGWLVRVTLYRKRQCAIIIQCYYRRKCAKRVLLRLREESRDVMKLREENLQLKRELMVLRQSALLGNGYNVTEMSQETQSPLKKFIAPPMISVYPSEYAHVHNLPPPKTYSDAPRFYPEQLKPYIDSGKGYVDPDKATMDSPERHYEAIKPPDDLDVAHEQINALCRQLLAAQIRYSTLQLGEAASRDDADTIRSSFITQKRVDRDRDSLCPTIVDEMMSESDEGDDFVEDMAMAPRPENQEVAQKQLESLQRKLAAMNEKCNAIELERECEKPIILHRKHIRATKDIDERFAPRTRPGTGDRRMSLPLSTSSAASEDEFLEDRVLEVRMLALQEELQSIRASLSMSRRVSSSGGTGSGFHQPQMTHQIHHNTRPSWSSPRMPVKTSHFTTSWARDTRCYECSIEFTVFTRRHHCRQCGNSFCHEHSTREVSLPHQGYDKPVRVCDGCYSCLLSPYDIGYDRDVNYGRYTLSG